jgi:hypothetical protein
MTDWGVLFSGESFKIGNKTIEIKPLGLEELSLLLRDMRTSVAALDEAGINLENYSDRFIELAEIITREAPDILVRLTGLGLKDVQRLPATIAVKILITCFRVNIDSQSDLSKNLNTLVGQVVAMLSAGEALE